MNGDTEEGKEEGQRREKGGKEEGESKGSDIAGDYEIFIKIKKKRQKVA